LVFGLAYLGTGIIPIWPLNQMANHVTNVVLAPKLVLGVSQIGVIVTLETLWTMTLTYVFATCVQINHFCNYQCDYTLGLGIIKKKVT
jgi:hypothetical protein